MRQLEDIDNDSSLDEIERHRRKHNLIKLAKMPPVSSTTTASVTFKPSSLPSCVTDMLEAMVGPNLDDLTLDDIDSSGLEAITPEVCLYVCVGGCVRACVCDVHNGILIITILFFFCSMLSVFYPMYFNGLKLELCKLVGFLLCWLHIAIIVNRSQYQVQLIWLDSHQ